MKEQKYTDLSFVELHGALFHAGKNFGLKLKSNPQMKLQFDEERKELRVDYLGRVCRLPFSSIHSMEEMSEPAQKVLAQSPVTDPPKGKVRAQVSNPHGHVFEGQGAGKTNDR